MDFQSQQPYVDVCLDYALAYSESALGAAFSRTVSRISQRLENAEYLSRRPINIEMGPFDVITTPTDVEHGLYFFFDRLTTSWPLMSFADYYSKIKADMVKCYVPFRFFSEESFQDSMRLRVYQDSMNIIAGRTLEGATSRSYSLARKIIWNVQKRARPAL
jgi:hypothetical protein